MKRLLALGWVLLLAACQTDTSPMEENDPSEETGSDLPNIMLIIADDMGLDATPGYAIGTQKPSMPNLETLSANGIRFNNLWSYSTCTPTRSSILTGKNGINTQVLGVGDELSITEESLQSYISRLSGNAYDQAVIGKWHLSSDLTHPTSMGVPYYSGLLSGSVQSYWDWNWADNGMSNSETTYTTTKFADLAIDWLDDTSKPWFLWLAFNAPHTPFHLPDTDLHQQGSLPTDQASIDANPLPYYLAMLEALDTELGRVINSLSQEERDNTIFIFIGDNGSPGQVVQEYNSRRSKGSIYQGGINVPLIISGKGVSRMNETEDALLQTTDLFATISQLAGINTSSIHDSQSFQPLLTGSGPSTREYAFAESRDDNAGGIDYAIRNETHKYILFSDGTEALYYMVGNFIENPNLLSANQAPLSAENEAVLIELQGQLDQIIN